MTDGPIAVLDVPFSRTGAFAGSVLGQHRNEAVGLRLREEWFTTLHDQNSAWLMRFAMRLTGHDRHRAEDVVQETLMRVWRFAAEPQLEDPMFLRPWLATIARRVSINAYRRSQRRPHEYYDEQQVELFSVSDGTDRVLRLMPIAEALRGLNRIHQEVLVEIYFHGRTVAETSRLLNIAPGTAKSRLHHALRAMREALLRQGDAGLITG